MAINGAIVLRVDSIALYRWGNYVGDSPHLQTPIELYWADISEIHSPHYLYGSCEYFDTLALDFSLIYVTMLAVYTIEAFGYLLLKVAFSHQYVIWIIWVHMYHILVLP